MLDDISNAIKALREELHQHGFSKHNSWVQAAIARHLNHLILPDRTPLQEQVMTNIPTWAWKEVDVRVGYTHQPDTTQEWAKYTDNLRRLAAGLIAEHEQPPVDPLLLEAREIAAQHCATINFPNMARILRDGKLDGNERVQIALMALHRGLELAKSRVLD